MRLWILMVGALLVSPCYADEVGVCSFYGNGEPLNPLTASMEPFDPTAMRCASWNYPLGTVLKVTNLANGKSVIVRVNDRGPAKRLNRVIDLTRESFRKIADLRVGLINVRITKVRQVSR